jgi:type III pantothenate kinase
MAAAHADFLLIDNSNSFTKFALSSRKQLEPAEPRRLATSAVNEASLTRVLGTWKYEAAILCSVVPAKGDFISQFLAPRRVLNVTAKTKLGVGIDYPQPGTIGADRLANAAGAFANYGAPVIVVDFGTAVSFDIVSPDGKYIGGVIAPGLESMTEYLHQRTALLPKISLLEPPSAIGKSTRHAMLAGAVYGYRGLVREILEQIRGELSWKKKLRVIATGGYAELIAAKLPEITAVQPELTLDGLRIIGNLNL